MKKIYGNRDPTNETKRYQFLQLIAICGELPVSLFGKLKISKSYVEKLITLLKSMGEVTLYYKDGIRGYRLTKKSKDELLVINRNRFEFYVTGNIETNHIRSELNRRLRLHRMAEIYLLMMNTNVAVFIDEKPKIFQKTNGQELETKISKACFYNSLEIKHFGDATTKINGSRSLGYLLTEKNVFIVYNTLDSLMKWSFNSELRNYLFTKHTFCKLIMKNFYDCANVKILVIGKSMEIAYDLLMTTIKIPKRNIFRINSEFESMLFLTNDHHGQVLLKLLCDPSKLNALNIILAKDYSPKSNNFYCVNDAIDIEGNPVLFCCIMDLIRITMFYGALNMHKKAGTVICFDFQKETLEKYFGNKVTIETLNFNKFKRRFFS